MVSFNPPNLLLLVPLLLLPLLHFPLELSGRLEHVLSEWLSVERIIGCGQNMSLNVLPIAHVT